MGASNDASKDAQRAEAERRAQVTATQSAIEKAYSTPQREADIQDVIAATKQYLGRDLSNQNDIANRKLKFALARSGQTMSSQDVDRHSELSKKYLDAAVEVQRRADTAGNTLRQSDQQSKLGLFSQAQAGLDMTTAVRNAGQMMASNLASAKSEGMQSGLGDLFSSLGDVYKRSLERAGTDKAEKYQYGTFYAPASASGGPFG